MRALLLVFLMGCLPKNVAVQAAAPSDVALAAVLTEAGGAEVSAVSEAVARGLADVLRARNLNARPAPEAAAAFSSRRTTVQRLAWLDAAEDTPMLVLVEAEARFFSQLGGQYRWTVTVSASVQSAGGVTTDSFEVPVFLSYDHEAEPEALDAALPVIERRLGALLDNTLRGLAAPGG